MLPELIKHALFQWFGGPGSLGIGGIHENELNSRKIPKFHQKSCIFTEMPGNLGISVHFSRNDAKYT